jgi:hypothetical protein
MERDLDKKSVHMCYKTVTLRELSLMRTKETISHLGPWSTHFWLKMWMEHSIKGDWSSIPQFSAYELRQTMTSMKKPQNSMSLH